MAADSAGPLNSIIALPRGATVRDSDTAQTCTQSIINNRSLGWSDFTPVLYQIFKLFQVLQTKCKAVKIIDSNSQPKLGKSS
ncbi:hypothetical protein D0A34_17615 [Microcoleus vaginatus PCC 9802]|nr:hypothetical protein D0A34_17615 [Microcoleus vaginatus PCC 9802]